ncbi:MAG: cell division protein FtsZ [Burkholderiales bacterium]|nr:cell division protein FtsZ [Burkholderiales bacterium]
MFEIVSSDHQGPVIKVVGVGGCGGNAVDHMVDCGVAGVEFISMNTDQQALRASRAGTVVPIGAKATKGLGAGAKPEKGREAALEDEQRITELIEGADMLFIAAGMGGGTGTGAAPIVAKLAKELGILTVAVVTKPFEFEGKRKHVAQQGLEDLAQHVDSLIVVPNEKLMAVLGDDVSMEDAFRAANGVLHGAVAGIAEVITAPGLVNVDFADVRTVMSETGMAMMGSAVATGPQRAIEAAREAAASPLLEDVDLKGARGVLVNITASNTLKLRELNDAMATVKAFAADDATVIVGTAVDAAMGDALRVTVVATGLGKPVAKPMPKAQLVAVQPLRTGTDPMPIPTAAPAGTGTLGAAPGADAYDQFDAPAITRRNRTGDAGGRGSFLDALDVPAFLRRQAD